MIDYMLWPMLWFSVVIFLIALKHAINDFNCMLNALINTSVRLFMLYVAVS